MDELNQGFTNDLSKTFDDDEPFDKVLHHCAIMHTYAHKQQGTLLSIGTRCPHCGDVVKKGV